MKEVAQKVDEDGPGLFPPQGALEPVFKKLHVVKGLSVLLRKFCAADESFVSPVVKRFGVAMFTALADLGTADHRVPGLAPKTGEVRPLDSGVVPLGFAHDGISSEALMASSTVRSCVTRCSVGNDSCCWACVHSSPYDPPQPLSKRCEVPWVNAEWKKASAYASVSAAESVAGSGILPIQTPAELVL